MGYTSRLREVLVALLLLGLAGCNEAEQTEQALEPVACHASDECHVCGMAVSGFPAPEARRWGKGGMKEILLQRRSARLVVAAGEPHEAPAAMHGGRVLRFERLINRFCNRHRA